MKGEIQFWGQTDRLNICTCFFAAKKTNFNKRRLLKLGPVLSVMIESAASVTDIASD